MKPMPPFALASSALPISINPSCIQFFLLACFTIDLII